MLQYRHFGTSSIFLATIINFKENYNKFDQVYFLMAKENYPLLICSLDWTSSSFWKSERPWSMQALISVFESQTDKVWSS